MEGQQVLLYEEGVIETPTQLARSFLLKVSNSTKAKVLASKARSGKRSGPSLITKMILPFNSYIKDQSVFGMLRLTLSPATISLSLSSRHRNSFGQKLPTTTYSQFSSIYYLTTTDPIRLNTLSPYCPPSIQ